MCTSVHVCLCFSLSALCLHARVCAHSEVCQGQIIAEHMWSEREKQRRGEEKIQSKRKEANKAGDRKGEKGKDV